MTEVTPPPENTRFSPFLILLFYDHPVLSDDPLFSVRQSDLKRHVHEQRHAAQNDRERHIDKAAHIVPQRAARLLAAGVHRGKQLILFHHIEPRDRAERRADGDDVDGDEVHPRAPLADRLHEDADAEAQHAQKCQHCRAAELGELVQQRLRHHLEHILQRAHPRENHRKVEDDGKQTPQRDILQDGRQRDKQQARSRTDIQPVGEARRDDDERRDHGGDGVKERRVLRHADHILILREIRAVDDHSAARDGEGEEGLSHRPDPDHRILERLPARREHEAVALAHARQHRNAHRKDEEDDEKERHHDPVRLFDAARAQIERQQRTHDHDHMIGDDGIGRGGKRAEPRARVNAHQRTNE